jgi:hypothetical protein
VKNFLEKYAEKKWRSHFFSAYFSKKFFAIFYKNSKFFIFALK